MGSTCHGLFVASVLYHHSDIFGAFSLGTLAEAASRFKYLILGLLSLLGVLVLFGSSVYSPMYVCHVLVWQDSDAFDWQKFPNHPLSASLTPYHFASSLDPHVEELFTKLSGAKHTRG